MISSKSSIRHVDASVKILKYRVAWVHFLININICTIRLNQNSSIFRIASHFESMVHILLLLLYIVAEIILIFYNQSVLWQNIILLLWTSLPIVLDCHRTFYGWITSKPQRLRKIENVEMESLSCCLFINEALFNSLQKYFINTKMMPCSQDQWFFT